MIDFRAYAGAALLKFLKIGRLTFGGSADSIRSAFDDKGVNEDTFWKAYQTNVWAYKGINVIATAAGQLPIRVVEETSSGNLEQVKNHPFVALFNNPNPFMTRQDLIELLIIFLESTGDGYMLLDDLSGSGRTSPLKLSQVKEIWPLPSHQMTAIPSPSNLISHYEFKPDRSGKSESLSADEVLHVRYPSPSSLLNGQGAIRPITNDLAADAYAANFEKFIMKNLAANIVFLKTASSFTSDQREEYRRSLANVLRGVRVAFMENGLEFASPQIAAKDLPFLELDTRRQKRILGALGVPPILVGSEDAKYDNAEQQKAVFWENTMLPKISRIGAMLTKKLHALGEDKSLSVILDTSAVKALQADYSKQAETAIRWHGMGVPVNNLIKVFGPQGLEEVEGGDVGLIGAGLIPIMDAIDPPEAVEPEGTPEDAPPPKTPSADDENDSNDSDEEPSKSIKSGASDRALDDAHWKRFVATSEPGFRRLRSEIRRFFKAQRKDVLARLRQASRDFGGKVREPQIDLILINVNEESKKLAKKTSPILKAIYQKLGKQAVADIGASIDFNVQSVAAVEFLSDHIFKFAFDVNNTTRARLTKILQDKFATGSTQSEITAAIQAEFGFAEKFRAARIARTESGIAGNSGFYDGMLQAEVEEKRWISSRDDKVRHSHEVADGQEVPIKEPFDVGGSLLMYPGDPEGPAEEIINCRCAISAARQRS